MNILHMLLCACNKDVCAGLYCGQRYLLQCCGSDLRRHTGSSSKSSSSTGWWIGPYVACTWWKAGLLYAQDAAEIWCTPQTASSHGRDAPRLDERRVQAQRVDDRRHALPQVREHDRASHIVLVTPTTASVCYGFSGVAGAAVSVAAEVPSESLDQGGQLRVEGAAADQLLQPLPELRMRTHCSQARWWLHT